MKKRPHNHAARTQGTKAARQESRHTGAPDDLELEKGSPGGAAPRRAPETRRLHDRPHDDPEEAELGASEDRACPPHEPHGSHPLHAGYRPQSPGALRRARAWRTSAGPTVGEV